MPELHLQQEKAIELLKDWSKWSAGLNFGASAGCIVMLQEGVSALVRIYLIGGVFFFSASTLVSSLIFLLLPAVIEQLPIQHKAKTTSIFDYAINSAISLRLLVALQFIFFLLGAISLFTWVLLKP